MNRRDKNSIIILCIILALAILGTLSCASVGLCAQDTDTEISVVLVGDIMLAWKAKPILEQKGADYPFEHTRKILQQADIAIGNLEMPLATVGSPVPEKTYTFRGNPDVAEGLARVGFDVFTLANNHIKDYGHSALVQTLEVLRANKLKYCGAGRNLTEARKPAIVSVKGKKGRPRKFIAVLSYSNTYPFEFYARKDRSGTARGLASYFVADIKSAKEKANFVVVSFHWGTEYTSKPRKYQRDFAHKAIDAGADVVFGHHPHILQGIEIYHKKPIAYSLGNFAMGSYNSRARRSVMMRVFLGDNDVNRIELLPINVLNEEVQFQSRLLTGSEAGYVIEQLRQLSGEWGTRIEFVEGKGVIVIR